MNRDRPGVAVEELSLEHFRLRGLEQGRLTGVSVAVHAISDAFLLMHCGVGCKHKATSQLSTHDWGRGVVEREGWTEVGDAELIAGAADRIGPYLRSWARRVEPGLMVVISVTFLDLTGDDTKSVVEQEATTVEPDVVYVDAGGHKGDLHLGYATALVTLAKRMDWKAPPRRPRAVGIVGYLFDRYEGDHAGNLRQLQRLLADVGLEAGPVMLSGVPWADVQAIAECGVLVQLPYVGPRAKGLRRLLRNKRTLVETLLPIGLRGSKLWMQTVARGAGADPRRAALKGAARARSVEVRLGPYAARLKGQRVAVFADLPLLAGLMSLLDELGLEVVVAGIRGHSFGGRAELSEALSSCGAPGLDGVEVLEDPSLQLGAERVVARIGQIDGVLASSAEINALATYGQEALHIDGRGPFVVEVGFPCKRYHAVSNQPAYGFAGVFTWAQRLLDAPRLWDSGLDAG